MTAHPQNRKICRIVVGLKAASDIEPPLDAATVLASAIKAEVVGLFIQEDAMFDLAGLPFAQAINAGSTRAQRLTPEAMQRAISRGELACERILSARAKSAHVKWSFTSERGNVPERIRAALTAGDFLVLPSLVQGFGARELLDELRTVPKHTRGVVIAARQPTALTKGPVIVIDDGDELGARTVSLAAQIASKTGAQLMLFPIAATDTAADHIIRRAHELAGPAARIKFHRFLPGTPRAIAAGLMHFMPSFVVADLEGDPFSDDRAALDLLRATQAPVVLVRATDDDVDSSASANSPD